MIILHNVKNISETEISKKNVATWKILWNLQQIFKSNIIEVLIVLVYYLSLDLKEPDYIETNLKSRPSSIGGGHVVFIISG